VAEVSFVERVAVSAVSVKPAKMLLTLLALPFYVLGWVLGVLFVVVQFAVAAVKVGVADARAKVAAAPVVPVAGAD